MIESRASVVTLLSVRLVVVWLCLDCVVPGGLIVVQRVSEAATNLPQCPCVWALTQCIGRLYFPVLSLNVLLCVTMYSSVVLHCVSLYFDSMY